MIDHDGSILSVYDKIHLVPFGEYLPFQNFLEKLGLMQLTKLPRRLHRRRAAPRHGACRARRACCRSSATRSSSRAKRCRTASGRGWLVNLTNDGWFGISSGPYQHLQQARVRTIEQGLPLVRAANTGISAVIDPLGRIIKSLPLGTEGVMDASLPRRIDAPLYARTGDARRGVLVIGAALIMIIRRRVKRG